MRTQNVELTSMRGEKVILNSFYDALEPTPVRGKKKMKEASEKVKKESIGLFTFG